MSAKTEAELIGFVKDWLGTGSINLFGMPFAGKDTQGRRLAEIFGCMLLGGGEILRSSNTPGHVKAELNRGHLAPTEYYRRLMLPYLSKPDFAGRPLVLSSVGRWHGEEPGVLEAAVAAGHPIKAAVYLKLNETERERRWQAALASRDRGARADDKPEVLKTRLNEFQNKTLPVIEFYREKDLLIEVDGSAAPEIVTTQIIAGLSECASQV